ncbi:MAG: tetratricopeptide repeat protein [Alphaproteobacteria bacterium]|nr:tetratricopeptide repeat protein [Alphaproteobacteria bacterium]
MKLILMAVALFAAAPAWASEPRDTCMEDDRARPAAKADACSAMIRSGYRQPNVYMHRGRAYLALSDYDRAIGDFSTAIKMDPGYADALSGRGLALAAKGRHDDAIDDYDRALEQRPDAHDYFNRGHSHLKTERPNYRKAVANFDEALELKPNWSAALNNRCWARALWRRDLELALTDCDLAVELRHDNASARDSRAFVYFLLGRSHDALAEYESVLEYKPDAPGALYMRGVLKLRQMNSTGHADIQNAVKLDPEIVRTYAAYGVKR